jgi:hypothetical protein
MTTPRRTALNVLTTVLAFAATSTAVFAQGVGSPARAIEGVWAMSITLRDCATMAPLGQPFRSLLTFHAGGTVSESPGTSQFAPGQRSPGHGGWSHSSGTTFRARIVAMILFDTPPAPPAPGFQAGWQLISSTFTLSDPDRLTSAATVQFFDINRQVYRSACPVGTAERFR